MALIIDSMLTNTEPLEYKLTLYNPRFEIISELNNAWNIQYTQTLRDSNMLTFKESRFVGDDGEEINEDLENIDIGYIIRTEICSKESEIVYHEEFLFIDKIEDNGIDEEYREVTCVGFEEQFIDKIIRDFSGVKKLYRTPVEIAGYTPTSIYPTLEDFINSGILNVIINMLPSWQVGDVDNDINELFRDIDVASDNVLNFLRNTVQQSFLCLFEYRVDSNGNKFIDAKNITNLGNNNGFFINENNYIKEILKTTDRSTVVTKLTMIGRDELNISSVNPTGEVFRMNLDYFFKDMSQSLVDAITSYNTLVNNSEGQFSTLLTTLNTAQTDLASRQADLELITGTNGTIDQLIEDKNELAREGSDLTSINAQIAAQEAQAATLQSQITALQSTITTTTNSINQLKNDLLITNNFTTEQISELDHYIKESEIIDETFNDAQELLEETDRILARLSVPCITFDIDIADLFSMVDAQLDWNKIQLGDKAYIRYENFDINIELTIVAFSHDFDSSKLTLTFANRQNINDPSMFFYELQNNTNNANAINVERYRFLQYIEDRPDILEFINNEIDLAKNKIIASNNNAVTLDQNGLTTKNIANPDNQILINSDGLLLTTDGYETADVAITSSGIIADRIIGNIILGAQLLIQNQDATFIINNNELRSIHTDGSFSTMSPSGFTRTVPIPEFTEQPTGVPNQENFTSETISSLESQGWEFEGIVSVVSDELLFGNVGGILNGAGIVYKFITQDNTSLSFTYRTASDVNGRYFFGVDGILTRLTNTTTDTTFTTTVNKGWHGFSWSTTFSNIPTDLHMFIDDVIFEQNPVEEVPTGQSSDESSIYTYTTFVGESSTIGEETVSPINVADRIIQLPQQFKNQTFKVFVALKNTGDITTDSTIHSITTEVVSQDNVNGTFRVKGLVERSFTDQLGSIAITAVTFTGVDFIYFATF